jgi:hypothetical protein
MTGFFWEPTKLFMRLERPVFLRKTEPFPSLPSSDWRLMLENESPVVRLVKDFSERSMAAKVVAAPGKVGLATPVLLAPERELSSGGGICGRWSDEDCWWLGCEADSLVASRRLRIAAPSNGAPIKSSETGWESESEWREGRLSGLKEKSEPLGMPDSPKDWKARGGWGCRGEDEEREVAGWDWW